MLREFTQCGQSELSLLLHQWLVLVGLSRKRYNIFKVGRWKLLDNVASHEH
jgi:hypothetical protein